MSDGFHSIVRASLTHLHCEVCLNDQVADSERLLRVRVELATRHADFILKVFDMADFILVKPFELDLLEEVLGRKKRYAPIHSRKVEGMMKSVVRLVHEENELCRCGGASSITLGMPSNDLGSHASTVAPVVGVVGAQVDNVDLDSVPPVEGGLVVEGLDATHRTPVIADDGEVRQLALLEEATAAYQHQHPK